MLAKFGSTNFPWFRASILWSSLAFGLCCSAGKGQVVGSNAPSSGISGIQSGGSQPAASQQSPNSVLQQNTGEFLGLGNGPISAFDNVDIRVFDAPEMSTRTQVSPDGDVSIPLLGVFHIAGYSAPDAARALEQALIAHKLLVAPRVAVLIQQFGKGITVIGQVKNPGIYRAGGNRTVVDLLALAGGLTDRAGHLINLYTPGDPAATRSMHWDPSLRNNRDAETPIQDGQTLEVSTCGIVYVGGNVQKPGAYPICDSLRSTITEAIAIAGGVKPSTKANSTLLIRENRDGTRTSSVLPLHYILLGKAADPIIEPDDIVYVPESDLKAGAKIAAQAAIGFASQAFVYSVQR